MSETNKLDPCRDSEIRIETSLGRGSEADGVGDAASSVYIDTRVTGAGTEGAGSTVGVV